VTYFDAKNERQQQLSFLMERPWFVSNQLIPSAPSTRCL